MTDHDEQHGSESSKLIDELRQLRRTIVACAVGLGVWFHTSLHAPDVATILFWAALCVFVLLVLGSSVRRAGSTLASLFREKQRTPDQ